MLKIGLTGGIGTGKTYLSRHFVDMGIPVYYADDEAKKLYRDPSFLAEMRLAFPDERLWQEISSCLSNTFPTPFEEV